jgi:hypothetical protein
MKILIKIALMLVFWTVWKLKTPRLRGFATPIGATLRENMESVESTFATPAEWKLLSLRL